ncbi:hypothetical protein PHYSODRAFT_295233 [Phytophthora sojae]|uniref:Uncharacterized protein n=1 Tax=Phytophthora sojae (strain P6497) TaxID=1094619 RepID=G4YQQ9_PHYSP|nr:hypothetical protein PHYSODRAFT_295233 [Phytophthora sojae]EGZ30430.1 hypothetical protein PHYSODRAFT_295233 [Phytophthora sojae]|eukprot:XP_009517705.1 hypothetical protein PHYSODRAFT_295233 [Phytophthora sojae]
MTSNTDRAAQKREQNRLRSARHRAIKRITMTDDERAEQRENNRLRNIEYRKRKRERTTDEERRTLREAARTRSHRHREKINRACLQMGIQALVSSRRSRNRNKMQHWLDFERLLAQMALMNAFASFVIELF